jgi:hypothetical protein
VNALKTIFAVTLILSTLTSCAIRSSQFSLLAAQFQGPTKALQSHGWTASYGQYKALVYAVSMPNGTLFSNQYGDRFLFDGWSIREVAGLGVNGADWKIIDSKKSRQFFNGNSLIAEYACGPWISVKQAGVSRFSQDCRSLTTHKNYILTNSEGHITLISQIINGGNKFITLSKNF